MADPILNEQEIILLLRAAASPDNVARLQTGAVQALIDLYDRKVTREEFLHSAAPCLTLYGSAAKLWLLENIHGVYAEGALDQERFTQAARGLEDLIRKQAESVIDIVRRMQLCPTSEDRVH
jgi:hypothetical protein